MSETAQRARNLTPEQLSDLVMRRKQRRDVSSTTLDGKTIARRNAGWAPLSFAQQRLWLLDQLEPGSAAYNLAVPLRVRGALDPAVMAQSLSEIARRHESMRTHFELRGDEPVQVISPAAPFPLPLIDLSGLPAAVREPEGWRLARRDASTGFDLSRGPLARSCLLRLGGEEHLLLFSMHHVISDGWSFGVLFGELSTLYNALVAGAPSPLAELPIQYADFALWQREWLRGPALQEQLAYWRRQLHGAAAALELPTDHVRPTTQSHRGENLQMRIPGRLAASLRELSRGRRVTFFMTLLAAFTVLLHRWAGQEDVVVGSPSAGRQRVETEGLIGFFLNTLVLRTDLGGNPSFLALLERVREVVLGAYRYQEVPFEKLLEELEVERQLSRPPLFQVLFNMITLPEMRLDLRGLRVEMMGAPETPAKFDFTLYVEERGGELVCDLLYNSDLFDPARMEALLAEYLHLLGQVAVAPETPIEALSLVAPEIAAVLPDPRRPLLAAPWPGPVHERLSFHAARAPEREAVRDGLESWCYGELEAGSNRLAHRLLESGVGRGDIVAIYAHRSASLAWAVFGTLKAGAAFLILDPAYPAARLLEYLRIARPVAWLAVRECGDTPAEVEELIATLAPRLRLELPPLSQATAEERLAGYPATPPKVTVEPGDLACIGFTSGSTGLPKGVAGLHGALAQYQPWWAERFELGEEERFGMLSALSHDPLQRDLLTPAWVGASLFIPDPERMGEPGWLTSWLAREEISVLHLTPAMLELVVGEESEPVLPRLRHAFVVGDLLRRGEVTRLQRIAPAVTCVNLYGSTETQRSVSYSVIPRSGAGKETLPLGIGIPGVELLVLNPAGELAGVGEIGEIHLRSRRLARGYLDDPQLTAERFLANPFRPAGEDPDDRLYRTGDLGRYRPDGEVEFAGRADQQVKIRGFRIEPGEIEAVLRGHPAVCEGVVVVRGEVEKRLVAYLAPAAGAVPAAKLRAFLADRLPDYMIPAAFVWLDALPLTRTGKVDRRALPEPAMEPPEGGTAPHTAVEELIAGIWGDLLEREPETIGVNDNFFDLGGHSLLATRALSRMRGALGVAVSLRTLFETPTVAGLAEEVERRLGDALTVASPLVPVPRGEGIAIPLSFTQQRMWILDQLEPGSFAYNLTTALRLHGRLEIATFGSALAEIVRRHEALRTVFAAGDDGEPRQVILRVEEPRLPVIDLATLPAPQRAAEAERLAAEDALRPFDLARGPLLRATLLRLAEREHALLLAFHHIVTDGWSMGIFTRELTELYRAFAAGAPSPLRSLPFQYADFAVWQRRWLREDVLADQLRYWMQHLAGAPAVLELPADRPRPAVQSHRGGRRWLTLPRELSARLAADSRRLEVTPFMVLLATFGALLGRYSGEEDLVVGMPIANRGRHELEELIGFFANTLALRINAGGDPTFVALAHRVREAALGTYAHQDLPFERLVDELQPERNLGHAPIFQVMLTLQNAPPPVLELGDLTFSALEVEEGRAQFDLSLVLMESAGDLVARLEYSSDLYDAATAERMLRHFGVLLASVSAAPRSRISALSLLSEAERHELLVTWNDTRIDFPEELTVPELFEATARRSPGAVAVSQDGQAILYGELEERANRLARRLLELGVGPEVRVGLCLQRTPEMLVALLAVLKAGGAYVPLDPTHPRERLGWILEDAKAPVLLVDRASLAALPEHGAVVIDPADAANAANAVNDPAAAEACRPLPRRALPENLAYVIYTSGSTGRPKGVAVRHRGVVNYLSSMARRPGMTESDTVLALTTLSFDIHVTELLLPLAVGARIELIDRETATDPERLGAVVESAEVTMMQATPATWTLLLEAGWSGRRGLKVLAGGEALPASLAGRLLEKVGSLWNVYGPTETTVWSALHPVTAEEGRIPIGRPLANTTIHLLDAGGGPAPVGVGGELCIGGEGLARGYHDRPDLTAERFIPDPFGSPGSRIYRTGDLARRRPGGDLEFLGRIDHQVKIRGFRIELGEIEAALLELPGVAQAAVVVREESMGDRRLVAFLSLSPGAAPAAAELRAGLLERLPDYMVPASFVPLAALPLSPSGKIDRRALSRKALDPALAEAGEEREYAAPRDSTESALAALWAELLGRERVGIHDKFFDLGGDSILTIRLVARARKEGIRFSPRQLFQHQTIAALAPVVVFDAPASGPRPATSHQRRLLALEPAILRRWNEAVLIVLPPGADEPDVAAALAALAQRHESLRFRFLPGDGGWNLEIAPSEEPVTIERLDLAGLPDRPVVTILAEEERDRIDLVVRPWTATRFHLGGGEPDLLLFAVHRLAADGFSLESLLHDLRSLLGAEAAPVSIPHPVDDGLMTELSAEETSALFGEVASQYGITPEELLATSLVQAMVTWNGARQVDLEVEVRPPGEPGAMAGSLGFLVALRAEVEKESAPTLKRIKDELRRAAAESAGEASPSEPAIVLRWRGRLDAGTLRPRPVFATGRTLEAVAGIVEGRLRIDWAYAEGEHRPGAVRVLADTAASALRAWIHHRPATEAASLTPSDFPAAAGLTQGELDDLLAELAID
ncbi:MAG: amino acid adenylation domain-containing protein [Thermoanaerobaculia bacterium]